MDCEFDIHYAMTPEELVEKAATGIKNQGGEFEGDTNSGSFSMRNPVIIRGNYTINGQVVHVAITKRPLVVPCNIIKNKLEELIN